MHTIRIWHGGLGHYTDVKAEEELVLATAIDLAHIPEIIVTHVIAPDGTKLFFNKDFVERLAS